MSDTMEQFWKNKYIESEKDRLSYLTLASRMTGYYGTIAKYDDGVPKHVKVRMLEALIKFWNDADPESGLTQEWIAGWEKNIKEISA